MSTNLASASVKVTYSSTFENSTAGLLSTPSQVLSGKVAPGTTGASFTHGQATANKADLVFNKTASIAVSGSETFDLDTGPTDAFGNTTAFVRVKAIVIENTSEADDLTLAGDFMESVGLDSGGIAIKPGGAFMLVAPNANGYAVTASTADAITLSVGGGASGAVVYKAWILGASA